MKPIAKKPVRLLFVFYLAVLTWIILLKMGFSFRELDRTRVVNLVPLAESYYSDGRLNGSELWNNVLIFVPMGVYLTMLWRKKPIWLRIGAAFCLSLLFEILQYALAVGVSDVTDLAANTAGGAAGVLITELLYRCAKGEERVDRALTVMLLIGSGCFAALAALLLLAN